VGHAAFEAGILKTRDAFIIESTADKAYYEQPTSKWSLALITAPCKKPSIRSIQPKASVGSTNTFAAVI
jgi:hypothetical protein